MQPWHRWREPLAVVLLVALALMLVIRCVALVLSFSVGNGVGYGGIPGGDDLLLLSTAAAVLWCTVPVSGPVSEPVSGSARGAESDGGSTPAPSPHARALAVAGLVVVGLSVLLWLVVSLATVAALVAWPSREIGFVLLGAEGVLRLVVPAVAVVAVVLALRRTRPVRSSTGSPEVTAAVPGTPAVTAAPERLPAAWQADEATGAVWLTADDAAQGQPGLSWSNPGPSGGAVAGGPWAPAPTPYASPAPSVSSTPSASPAPSWTADPAPYRAGESTQGDPNEPARPPRPSASAEDDDLR